MRKLRVLPAVAFGVLTLGGVGAGSHTASAAPVDPVDDPRAVDENVDVDPTAPADTEAEDPADPEVADPTDAEAPDSVAVDEEDDDNDAFDDVISYGEDVVREARAPSHGGATVVASSGSLPQTGSETSSVAIIGAFAMMIGGVMHRVSSRREPVVR